MRINGLTSGLIAVALLLGSCSTPKNITYFQDAEQGAVVEASKQLDIRVRPEDKLSIVVTTQHQDLSNLYNLALVSSKSSGSSSTSRANDGSTSCYTVDKYGDISFPVLGKLHIGGMTRYEVAEFVENKLKSAEQVKDPIVTVEFVNTGVTVIGEVQSPGRYDFNRDRINIVDAIAMAGDLTPNGRRENVLVLRETEGGKQLSYRLDMTDLESVVNSPAYHLQQNDVIYVEPSDKKKRDTTPLGNSPFTPSFWVSIGSLALTVTSLIITLTR